MDERRGTLDLLDTTGVVRPRSGRLLAAIVAALVVGPIGCAPLRPVDLDAGMGGGGGGGGGVGGGGSSSTPTPADLAWLDSATPCRRADAGAPYWATFEFRNTGTEPVVIEGGDWSCDFRPSVYTCAGVALSSTGFCSAPEGGTNHCDPCGVMRVTIDAGTSIRQDWRSVVTSPYSSRRLLTIPPGQYQARRTYTSLDGGSPRTAIRNFDLPTDGGVVLLDLVP